MFKKFFTLKSIASFGSLFFRTSIIFCIEVSTLQILKKNKQCGHWILYNGKKKYIAITHTYIYIHKCIKHRI